MMCFPCVFALARLVPLSREAVCVNHGRVINTPELVEKASKLGTAGELAHVAALSAFEDSPRHTRAHSQPPHPHIVRSSSAAVEIIRQSKSCFADCARFRAARADLEAHAAAVATGATLETLPERLCANGNVPLGVAMLKLSLASLSRPKTLVAPGVPTVAFAHAAVPPPSEPPASANSGSADNATAAEPQASSAAATAGLSSALSPPAGDDASDAAPAAATVFQQKPDGESAAAFAMVLSASLVVEAQGGTLPRTTLSFAEGIVNNGGSSSSSGGEASAEPPQEAPALTSAPPPSAAAAAAQQLAMLPAPSPDAPPAVVAAFQSGLSRTGSSASLYEVRDDATASPQTKRSGLDVLLLAAMGGPDVQGPAAAAAGGGLRPLSKGSSMPFSRPLTFAAAYASPHAPSAGLGASAGSKRARSVGTSARIDPSQVLQLSAAVAPKVRRATGVRPPPTSPGAVSVAAAATPASAARASAAAPPAAAAAGHSQAYSSAAQTLTASVASPSKSSLQLSSNSHVLSLESSTSSSLQPPASKEHEFMVGVVPSLLPLDESGLDHRPLLHRQSPQHQSYPAWHSPLHTGIGEPRHETVSCSCSSSSGGGLPPHLLSALKCGADHFDLDGGDDLLDALMGSTFGNLSPNLDLDDESRSGGGSRERSGSTVYLSASAGASSGPVDLRPPAPAQLEVSLGSDATAHAPPPHTHIHTHTHHQRHQQRAQNRTYIATSATALCHSDSRRCFRRYPTPSCLHSQLHLLLL
jgi:hypothetical protein